MTGRARHSRSGHCAPDGSGPMRIRSDFPTTSRSPDPDGSSHGATRYAVRSRRAPPEPTNPSPSTACPALGHRVLAVRAVNMAGFDPRDRLPAVGDQDRLPAPHFAQQSTESVVRRADASPFHLAVTAMCAWPVKRPAPRRGGGSAGGVARWRLIRGNFSTVSRKATCGRGKSGLPLTTTSATRPIRHTQNDPIFRSTVSQPPKCAGQLSSRESAMAVCLRRGASGRAKASTAQPRTQWTCLVMLQ